MAIEIVLDEETRYRISADKYNVVLSKAYWSKTNNQWMYSTANNTFHSDFGRAIERMIQKELGNFALESNKELIQLRELADKINKFSEEVRQMFQNLPKEIMGEIPHKYYLDEEEE